MPKRIEHDLVWQKSIDTGTKRRPCFEEVNKMFKNYYKFMQSSVDNWISKKQKNLKIH